MILKTQAIVVDLAAPTHPPMLGLASAAYAPDVRLEAPPCVSKGLFELFHLARKAFAPARVQWPYTSSASGAAC
jgi:hypothetical protein